MSDRSRSEIKPRNDRSIAVWAAFAVLLVFFGTRAVEAFHKSLWLDELHTLHVARPSDVGETIARILPDFHAPLYFLAVHFFGTAHPHAARILSILGSLATLSVIDRMLRERGRSGPARLAAAAAFAALPYQVQYGAELRPYAWMQLAAVLLAHAGTTKSLSKGSAFALFLAAATFGLYTHYLTAVSIIAVGAVTMVPQRGVTLGFLRTVAAGTLAVVLFLPWIYYDERWIFTDPGVMTKDEKVEPTTQPVESKGEPPTPRPLLTDDVLWALPRTLAPMGGMLGRVNSILIAGGLLICAAALCAGISRRLFYRGGSVAAAAGSSISLVVIAAIASIIVLALSLYLWRRIAIQYFVVGAWIWPIVIASAIDGFKNPATSRRVALVLAAALGIAGFAHAIGAPREDIRAAVEYARREATDSSAVFTAVLRQPPHYSHLEPFIVYAPDVAAIAPEKIPAANDPSENRTIFVVTRGFDWRESDAPRSVWGSIVEGRTLTLLRRWSGGIAVYRAAKK